MQEILPFVVQNRPNLYLEVKAIARTVKVVIVAVWRPIGWLLTAIFTAPPEQEYIEQNRVKAMRLIGHF
ncbi:MAG: hypothetical protein AB7K68_15095 [Bacteriovoracia bacterium]